MTTSLRNKRQRNIQTHKKIIISSNISTQENQIHNETKDIISRERSTSVHNIEHQPRRKRHCSMDNEIICDSTEKICLSDIKPNSKDEKLESIMNINTSEESLQVWIKNQKEKGISGKEILDLMGLSIDKKDMKEIEIWKAITLIEQGIHLSKPVALQDLGLRFTQPIVMTPRKKLIQYNTLEDVINLLDKSKKVVILAGAGISVSCGIPDFRSENGIYSRLGEYNLPNPQSMFDINYFRYNPKPFFAFAKELFPKANGFTFVPSKSHYFIKLLQDKGKLLRIYSQNIDMLEEAAGISRDCSVLCHGSFATATCLYCRHIYDGDHIREKVLHHQVPMCQKCNAEDGIIKPDIVFFGEPLPKHFHESIEKDQVDADLVIVMGSSLKVNPVRDIIGRFRPDTPMILVNREPVGRPHAFDVELLGYSDDIVEELCHMLNWELPKPDPALLKELPITSVHLPNYSVSTASAKKPPKTIKFESVPPSRYLFPGSKVYEPTQTLPTEEVKPSSSSLSSITPTSSSSLFEFGNRPSITLSAADIEAIDYDNSSYRKVALTPMENTSVNNPGGWRYSYDTFIPLDISQDIFRLNSPITQDINSLNDAITFK